MLKHIFWHTWHTMNKETNELMLEIHAHLRKIKPNLIYLWLISKCTNMNRDLKFIACDLHIKLSYNS